MPLSRVRARADHHPAPTMSRIVARPVLGTEPFKKWAVAHLLPRVLELYNDQTNYMYRLTAFLAINTYCIHNLEFKKCIIR